MIIRPYQYADEEFVRKALEETKRRWFADFDGEMRMILPGIDPSTAAAMTVTDDDGNPHAVLTARLVYEVDLYAVPGDPRAARAVRVGFPYGLQLLTRLTLAARTCGLPYPHSVIASTPEDHLVEQKLLRKASFEPEHPRLRYYRRSI